MIETLRRNFLLPLVVVFLFVSCGSNDAEEATSGAGPRIPEDPVEFVNANLVYYGTESAVMTSCHYKLSLYTDMQIDGSNNPIGPGSVLRLSINGEVFESGVMDFSLPMGRYEISESSHAFDPWTFNTGFMVQLDLPSGKIEVPEGSFFGKLAEGETALTPDLFDSGLFMVERKGDVYTISGTISGDKCIKRKFVYTGKMPVIDRSEGGQDIPNSNLTGDVNFAPVQARLHDKLDHFALGDESIRVFELYLSSSELNLAPLWPEGNGQTLKLEFFVPWSTDVMQGIPAGTYTVVPRTISGGINRTDLVAGGMASGAPDRFTYPGGTWYQIFTSSQMTGYGRIDSGAMTVTRDGAAHHISFDFVDCDTTTPHHIRGEYSSQTPITVYK